MEKVRVGIIGLGQRGRFLMEGLFVHMDSIEISAICDVYEDRIEENVKYITDAGRPRPFTTTNWKEVVDKSKVDAVLILTPWNKHTEMAIYCMEAGIPCGSEVGGAETIDECFRLVEAYERTKTPYMFMENCNYGRREMMALNMVKMGVFGEVVHCAGGYCHDLRDEISFGKERKHYRLKEYLNRNCENYPTHELGPIANVLDINRGNRFVSLSSTSSKSAGLHDYILREKADDTELVNATFAQGDIVTTVITCERGETITLTLDTTLPRFYSRGFTVRGTLGMYEEATDSVFFDGDPDHFEWKKHWGNAEQYAEKYEHEVWKKYLAEGVKGGHDGMDYLVYSEFVRCVREGLPMPIDVYDAAALMSITPLSEASIKAGGVPQRFPIYKK